MGHGPSIFFIDPAIPLVIYYITAVYKHHKKIYVNQLMDDTKCKIVELSNAMNDRGGWKKHVIQS